MSKNKEKRYFKVTFKSNPGFEWLMFGARQPSLAEASTWFREDLDKNGLVIDTVQEISYEEARAEFPVDSCPDLPVFGDWVCTDSDTCQYVQRLGKEMFELRQVILTDPENDRYTAVGAVIGLDDYDEEELLMYLGFYGYTALSEVELLCGNEAKQVIAECVFESLEPDEYEVLHSGSFDECEAFLKKLVGDMP